MIHKSQMHEGPKAGERFKRMMRALFRVPKEKGKGHAKRTKTRSRKHAGKS